MDDGGQSPIPDGGVGSAASYAGRVQMQLLFSPNLSPGGGVYAAFGAPGTFSDLLACPGGVTMVGSCCFIPATASDAGPALVSAGDITVSDNGSTYGSMHFSSQAYDDIGSPTNPSTKRGWAPGDTLQVVASGATTPGFSGSIVAPDALAGVTPSPTAPTISLSADWTTTWTSSATALSRILVEVSSQESPNPDIIKCAVDDSAGSLTVPASLLARLKPVNATEMIVARGVRSSVGTGSAAVEIVALSAIEGNAKLVP